MHHQSGVHLDFFKRRVGVRFFSLTSKKKVIGMNKMDLGSKRGFEQQKGVLYFDSHMLISPLKNIGHQTRSNRGFDKIKRGSRSVVSS